MKSKDYQQGSASPAPDSEATRQGVVRIFAEFLGSRAAQAVAVVISVAIITRAVPVAQYGYYATAVSFATLLAAFTDLGASQILVREVEKRGYKPAVSAYLTVRGLLTVATLAIGVALVPLLFAANESTLVLLALTGVVLAGPSLIWPLGQVTHNLTSYRHAVLAQSFTALGATAVVLFVFGARTAGPLVVASLAGALVGTVLAAIAVRHDLPLIRARLGAGTIIEPLRAMAVLGLAAVLISIYYRIDSVMVLRISGPDEAAMYGGAYRLFDQARLVPGALLVTLGPLLAKQMASGRKLSVLTDRALQQLTIEGGIGLALVSIALARPSVAALMGPKYDEAARLFVLLSVSLGFMLMSFTAGGKAINSHRERGFLLTAGLGVALNIALNLVLISQWGAAGAALATLVTEFVVLLANLTLTRAVSTAGHRRYACVAAATTAMVAFIDLRLIGDNLQPRIEWSVVLLVAGGWLLTRAGSRLGSLEY
jgi:O-antigen/teichoic acid export membrane protein